MTDTKPPQGPTRTPAERERMYRWLYEMMLGCRWPMYGTEQWANSKRVQFDRLLAAFPQLWDSLSPDPAEQARREAEEDRRTVEHWRAYMAKSSMPYTISGPLLEVIDHMAARAKAGHMVLADREGE